MSATELQGTQFHTYKAAAAFMKHTKTYNQNDIAQLYLYPDGKIKSRSYRHKDWKAPDYLSEDRQCKTMKEGKCEILVRTKRSKGWKTNEYLPEGWQCKNIKKENQEFL